MSWTGAHVQRLDLRKRPSLGLGTPTGAPGQPGINDLACHRFAQCNSPPPTSWMPTAVYR